MASFQNDCKRFYFHSLGRTCAWCDDFDLQHNFSYTSMYVWMCGSFRLLHKMVEKARYLQWLNERVRKRDGAQKHTDWNVWVFFGNTASIAVAYKVSNIFHCHCFLALASLCTHLLLSTFQKYSVNSVVFFSSNSNDDDDGDRSRDDVHLQIFQWIQTNITTKWYAHFIIISFLLFCSLLPWMITTSSIVCTRIIVITMVWYAWNIFLSHLSCQVLIKLRSTEEKRHFITIAIKGRSRKRRRRKKLQLRRRHRSHVFVFNFKHDE